MKTQEDDLLVYDEDDAVKFILNFLPEDAKKSIDDSKIEYVLDVVYEFYDENGLIEEDSTGKSPAVMRAASRSPKPCGKGGTVSRSSAAAICGGKAGSVMP